MIQRTIYSWDAVNTCCNTSEDQIHSSGQKAKCPKDCTVMSAEVYLGVISEQVQIKYIHLQSKEGQQQVLRV